MIHKSHWAPFILFVILFLTDIAFGQNSLEISKLKERISVLEKKVNTLEKMIGKSPSKNLQYSEKWKNRTFWRKLKMGMSMNEVESLLGTPIKVSGGSFTSWYYTEVKYSSFVIFYNGSVDRWEEPE